MTVAIPIHDAAAVARVPRIPVREVHLQRVAEVVRPLRTLVVQEVPGPAAPFIDGHEKKRCLKHSCGTPRL